MFTAALLLLQSQALPPPLDVYGRWQVEGERGVVTVEDCGDGTPCGRLTGLPEDASEEGEALLGTRLLWGFEREEDEWDDGKVRDPEEGRTYRAQIARDGDVLVVTGCWGPFCRDQRWQAAE